MRPSRFIVAMFVSLALPTLVGTCSAQTVTILYSFPKKGGLTQDLALIQGRDGQLYGTTVAGGTHGDGTVFKISTLGVVRAVYSFDSIHGAGPVGGLSLASDGSFYGTTAAGGSGTPPEGVIFKVSPSRAEQVLVNLDDSTGVAGIPPVEATDGNLYGETDGTGGRTSVGGLFKLTGGGVFSTLYTFDGLLGSYPEGKLVQATDNRLYGVADSGGAHGCGSIFEFALNSLPISAYDFDCVTANNPVGGLILANDGNFYGTTDAGGTHGLGVIYRFDQSGVFTVLYNFGDTAFDSFTHSAVVQATDGNLYGTIPSGGVYGYGTLFQITLQGVYTRISNFSVNGTHSVDSGLMQHTNGAIYGESRGGGDSDTGTIYRLDMGLGPFVAFVIPTGKVGKSAQILGQGLTGTTSVTFNGVEAASFKVVSDTYVTAVVPSDATTGKVVVTMPSGALTSNVNFRIIQ